MYGHTAGASGQVFRKNWQEHDRHDMTDLEEDEVRNNAHDTSLTNLKETFLFNKMLNNRQLAKLQGKKNQKFPFRRNRIGNVSRLIACLSD